MAIYELSERVLAQRKNEVSLKVERVRAESELSRLLAENPQLISNANMFGEDLIQIRDLLTKKKGFQRYSINNYWDKSKKEEFLETCKLLDMPSLDEKFNLYEGSARTMQRNAIKSILGGSFAYKHGKDLSLLNKTNLATSILIATVPILTMDALAGYLGYCYPEAIEVLAIEAGIVNLLGGPLFTAIGYGTLSGSSLEVGDPLTYISKEIKERAQVVSEYAN